MNRRISVAAVLLAVLALAGLAVRTTVAGPTDAAAGSPAGPGKGSDATTDAEDGTVVATDDGRFFFLWRGGKQRIQQPAAFDEADLAGLGLRIGPRAPRVLEVGGVAETRFGSSFVMVPADGPEARLHLLRRSSLHPLDVVRVDAEALASVPDLSDTVIDRVTF